MNQRQAKKVLRSGLYAPTRYRLSTWSRSWSRSWRANNRTAWPGTRSWRWGRWDPCHEPKMPLWTPGSSGIASPTPATEEMP